MIQVDITICPKCGGDLKFFDKVKRITRAKNRAINYIEVRRFKCRKCKSVHREIPAVIFPFKHYEAEIILGVIHGLITPNAREYEDYPCETTMNRWVARKEQILLWKNNFKEGL